MKTLRLLLQYKTHWKKSSQRLSVRWLSEFGEQQFSYVHRASPIPTSYVTIGQLLDRRVDTHGDTEAVVSSYQNIRKTFTQVKEDVNNFAAGLLAIGLKPGDRVAFWGPNCYEFILTQYALGKAGMIQVCLNPAYKSKELEHGLREAGVKCLISSESFRNKDLYSILCNTIPNLPEQNAGQTSFERLPEFKHAITLADKNLPGTTKFYDILKLGENESKKNLETVSSKIQPEHPFLIIFTSGTTGLPKAACLTQFSMINNSYFSGVALEYDKKPQRLCIPLPMFHVFCIGIGTVSSLIFGLTGVYPTPVFNTLANLQAVHNEKCTAIYGTTTMHLDLLHHPDFDKYDLSTIKTVVAGGSLVPEEVARAIGKKICSNIIIGYGCTECSMCISTTYPSDSFERRTSTVGRIAEHVEVKIVDRDGLVVKFGEPGEILTRGYHLMNGYWNDEKKTKEVFAPGGWYKTGDLGTLDKEGFLVII